MNHEAALKTAQDTALMGGVSPNLAACYLDLVAKVKELEAPLQEESADYYRALYFAQCACTDEWEAKYRQEASRKGNSTLLWRITDLENSLAQVNVNLTEAQEVLAALDSEREGYILTLEKKLAELARLARESMECVAFDGHRKESTPTHTALQAYLEKLK